MPIRSVLGVLLCTHQLQVHFVVVSNGQQADNENAKDKLVVKPATRKPETEPAAAPEAAAAAEAVAPAEPLLVAEPAPASESAPSPDPNPTFEVWMLCLFVCSSCMLVLDGMGGGGESRSSKQGHTGDSW